MKKIDLNNSTETTPSDTTVQAALPDGYLKNGYHIGTDKARYSDPALVSSAAQSLAAAFAAGGLKPSAFNPLLRPLKKANKRAVPFEAQKGTLLALVPKVMLLVQKKRAPRLLLDMVQANLAALTDSNDFNCCYQHLEAVGAFLALTEEGE